MISNHQTRVDELARPWAFGPIRQALFRVTLISFTAVAAAAAEADQPWFTRSLVGLEVGPTGAQFGHSDPNDAGYCARFDGREIVRRTAAAGGEYLVLWGRDGDYAYYDSKLLPKAPGLGDRDPLKEAVDEASKHRLPLIVYCVVQQGGHFLAAHPDWEMRGADGKPLGRFCLNSGYLEMMKQILAEQLAYGIAGFHVDMLDQGFGPPYGCWCETCRKEFREHYGHDMPQGATWDEAWDQMLEFRYRSSERFEKQLTAHIKSLDPRATVDYNYHGNPPFSFEVGQRPVQHAGNADFVTGETGVWGFSALGVGLNAEFYRASTPGRPYQVAMQRGVRMYHDQTTRPVNDIRWELFTLLSHGAFVTMVDKTGFDGWLDPLAYDRFQAAFAEVKKKREHFGHQPLYDVGLYFSSRSRDWFGREEPARYFQGFQGAHRACVLEHIQFGVLFDENLSIEGLGRYPVVCLPNVAILSDREVGLLRQYVEQGGRLIVTGQSGQWDRLGNPLAESTLSGLIGAEVKSRLDSIDNWVRFPTADSAPDAPADSSTQSALCRNIRLDWPFLVKGPATAYEPTSATAIGQLLKPHRTARQLEGRMGTEWPMSADSPVGPAVLVHRIGKGTVLTLAASPDFATGGEHALVEARTLLGNAIRLLHPAPRVRVTAPANVEAVVTDDPDRRILRVHLIAYNPTPRSTPSKNRPFVLPGLIEDAPIFRVSLELSEELAGSLAGVEAVNPATVLRGEGRNVEATIEDIHEVLLIRY
jgi:hypothetical protein